MMEFIGSKEAGNETQIDEVALVKKHSGNTSHESPHMETVVRLEDALLFLSEMPMTSAHWTFSKPLQREQSGSSARLCKCQLS